jgi:hypothetical protein
MNNIYTKTNITATSAIRGKQPTSKQGNRRNAVLINKRMTHGGVLGGMLRDIGGTSGIVSFKNCDKRILNEILTEWRVDDEW